MTRWVAVVVGMSGCAAVQRTPSADAPSTVSGPAVCVEDSSEVVEQPGAEAHGVSFAATDALAEVEGTWEGNEPLGGVGGGPATVDVEVAWDEGEIDVIYRHLEGGAAGDSGALAPDVAAGPVAPECEPVYELGFHAELVAEAYLAGSGAARVRVGSSLAVDLPIEIDQGAVTGTLLPPDWDEGAPWDRTVLALAFHQANGDPTSLDLAWQGVDDAEGTGVQPAEGRVPIATLSALVRIR